MFPLILMILDGWGCSSEKKDNGIAEARTPHFDHYWKSYPHTLIEASGPAVGLPPGIMGNSEVGHMNMGAGRIVYTGLSQIYKAIEDGSFSQNPALLSAIQAAKKNQSPLHLMGLVSDGAVHSHQDHLYALLDLAKKEGLKQVFIHCFMDGRDTPPMSGLQYLQQLEEQIQKKGIGQIASVSGRYYAMDRDKRWERVQKAYNAVVGVETEGASSAEEIVQQSYQSDIGDEFIVPKVVLNKNDQPCGPIQDGDTVIFFNFRADRAREMTQALTDPIFQGFSRAVFPKLSSFICMAPYDETFKLPIAFPQNYPQNTFGELISNQGLSQLRIAETEKYAHVTFFFSGGKETPFPGEERILIPSPREVATYDLKPEMSANRIAQEVCRQIEAEKFDVILLNFANPDMVGHTAKPKPIVEAIETIDHCLSEIVNLVLKKKGQVIITADHGNAEQMVDAQGKPHTAHTTNPVPFILISDALKNVSLKKSGGRLCDVAPTLLAMLQIPQPKEMSGENLISK